MSDKVLVGGSSAGAHLAMMVPHIWQSPPLSIFAIYGPTDLTSIRPIERTVESLQAIPPITPEIIKASLFDTPQTFTVPASGANLLAPRALLGLEFFRGGGGIGEFLAGGLTPEFGLRKLGSLPIEEIAKISPALLPLTNYPPLFQVIGTDDQIFSLDQAAVFADKLQAAGVSCETLIVTGAQHGFDGVASLGGEVHRNVMLPAVEFVCQVLEDEVDRCRSRGTVTIDRPADCFVFSSKELNSVLSAST